MSFSRRGFFVSLSTAVLAIQITKGHLLGWGYMDVPRHVVFKAKDIHLRVWLDGEDVTGRCFEADDQLGYIGLFKHRNGQAYVDFSKNPPEVAREWRHGRVEFIRQ